MSAAACEELTVDGGDAAAWSGVDIEHDLGEEAVADSPIATALVPARGVE